ncbi:tRNA(Ile)-lysidine synthase [subsurface metagenome]
MEQLSQLSQSAQRFYKLVCDSAEKVWPVLADCAGDSLKLDLKSFLAQPEPVKVELVRRSLACIGSGEKDLTRQHYERILQIAQRNIANKKIELPDGFAVWREYGSLIFGRAKERPKEKLSESVELEVPGQTRFGDYLAEAIILESKDYDVESFKMDSCLRRNDTAVKTNLVEWFDLDKVNLPLVVRFRQVGDRFWPLGLGGQKKVGKFLTAAKVPQELRQKLLIVADSEKIIWVWPVRISEQAKITDETRKILQLQITDAHLAR